MLVIAACGGGGGGTDSGQVTVPLPVGSPLGGVAVKGPLANATLKAFVAIDYAALEYADRHNAPALRTATSNPEAAFESFLIPDDAQFPLVIEAIGTNAFDLSTYPLQAPTLTQLRTLITNDNFIDQDQV
ncbi:MAG: hypothetical protein WBN40_01540, partial [Pseudomonadales bacterium]